MRNTKTCLTRWTCAGAMLTLTILTMGVSAPPLVAYTETLPGSVVKLDMVPIPGGTITIGGKAVTVKPLWMAKTDTVWEAFDVFLASGPASPPYDQTKFPVDAIARPSKSYILPDLGWGHHGYPVINVSFDSVTMFCRWLSKVTHKKYRLPTEAEWEWAARAGDTKPWPLDFDMIERDSWYNGNSKAITHPVGMKAPNKFGLFDMLGDVGNWAIGLDDKPVLCGASFLDGSDDVAPTTRKHWTPKWQESDPQLPKSRWWLSDGSFVGFRVVCEP